MEDECALTEMIEGHLESFRNRSLRRDRKKSNFQIELDRLMSEVEEEQSSCATADHIETNSLGMTKLSVRGAELAKWYACIT